MWSRRSNIALIGLAGVLWLLLAPGPAQGSIEVGYDLEQGTYVRTSDRRWEFNPYAMVQLLNVTSVPQGAPASTSVAVHAAKLIFHGHVFSPKLTYHFQVNFGEGRAVAENMYLYYQPLRWLGLLVGQTRRSTGFCCSWSSLSRSVTVCRSGGRSATAATVLTVAGFKDVRSLDGGMRRWTELGLPVEK